jgi:hypothetical protein
MKNKYLTPEELKQEEKNLIAYTAEMKHLYASDIGKGQYKRLFITGNGEYLIEHHAKEVLRTPVASVAIKTFYEL